MTDTDALRALLAKATPRPWNAEAIWGDCYSLDNINLPGTADDARLIVAAVNALPALLDELDLQRGAARAQDARDLAACLRVGEPPWDCDTSDHLADIIEELRAELDAARKRIAELEHIVDVAREAAACSGECVMTVAGCQTHNWDDPCAMAELRAALRAPEAK